MTPFAATASGLRATTPEQDVEQDTSGKDSPSESFHPSELEEPTPRRAPLPDPAQLTGALNAAETSVRIAPTSVSLPAQTTSPPPPAPSTPPSTPPPQPVHWSEIVTPPPPGDTLSLRLPVGEDGRLNLHLRLSSSGVEGRLIASELALGQKLSRELPSLQAALAQAGVAEQSWTLVVPRQLRLNWPKASQDKDKNSDRPREGRSQPTSEQHTPLNRIV
ncbi:MAG: hypothetical protein RL885_12185 [Planctomycetota bacterium]